MYWRNGRHEMRTKLICENRKTSIIASDWCYGSKYLWLFSTRGTHLSWLCDLYRINWLLRHLRKIQAVRFEINVSSTRRMTEMPHKLNEIMCSFDWIDAIEKSPTDNSAIFDLCGKQQYACNCAPKFGATKCFGPNICEKCAKRSMRRP